MKALVKSLLRSAGYTLGRVPQNRFDALSECLTMLSERGYQPSVVIDAGANRGDWTRTAKSVWPSASFHLIEPQSAFFEELSTLGRVYSLAVTKPETREVCMVGSGTGRWVGADGDPTPASTLDSLFAGSVRPEDRALLKLDLENHELAALDGASVLLRSVEVIVCEVWFLGSKTFLPIANLLDRSGFIPYDFAALASRERDKRLRTADAVFVRRSSPLAQDDSWA